MFVDCVKTVSGKWIVRVYTDDEFGLKERFTVMDEAEGKIIARQIASVRGYTLVTRYNRIEKEVVVFT